MQFTFGANITPKPDSVTSSPEVKPPQFGGAQMSLNFGDLGDAEPPSAIRRRTPLKLFEAKEILQQQDGPPSSPPMPPQGAQLWNPVAQPPTARPLSGLQQPSPMKEAPIRTPSLGQGQWNIPAMRSIPASVPLAGVTSTLPRQQRPEGAVVVRFGRREAWRRFLCYEGCIQICLNGVLQGGSEYAPGFLQDSCRKLKSALDLENLFLPPVLPGDTSSSTGIYWDDREEAQPVQEPILQLPLLEDPPEEPEPPQQNYDNLFNDNLPPPQSEAVRSPPPPPQSVVVTEDDDDTYSVSDTYRDEKYDDSDDEDGMRVETNVVRVIGCQMLADDGLQRARFRIVIHHAGTEPDQGGAWANLTASGGTMHGAASLQLHSEGPRGTLLVQLYKGHHPVAAGTVQVAELEKIANQQQPEADQVNYSSGFLRQMLDNITRSKRDAPASMVCIKLVDAQGDVAGHAVLTARQVVDTRTVYAASSTKTTSIAIVPERPASVANSSPARRVSSRQHTVGQSNRTPAKSPLGTSRGPLSTYREESLAESVSALRVTAPPSASSQQPEASAAAEDSVPVVSSKEAKDVVAHKKPEKNLGALPADFQGAAKVSKGGDGGGSSASGYLHVTVQHAYNELLNAALRSMGCGPARLKLEGAWKWLTEAYSNHYGVPHAYTSLAHLRWIVRRENATPTALCLETLLNLLTPLIRQRESGELSSAESALLARVISRVEDLLKRCFECYYALDEGSEDGIAEGALVRGGGAPAALRPAVALTNLLKGDAPQWMADRFRAAARDRFKSLLAAAEARNNNSTSSHQTPVQSGESAAAVIAYHRVGELATCLISELKADESVKGSGVLIGCNLPDVTASEHAKGIVNYLQKTLEKYPPASPTPPVVALVENIGALQEYVNVKRFTEAATRLNSGDIFGDFVHRWIEGTAAGLARTCAALQRANGGSTTSNAGCDSTAATTAQPRVSPLIERMLSEVESEMRRYKRIVAHWPVHGPELEGALVGALRAATDAASKQCGLMRSRETGGGGRGGQAGGAARVAWKWVKNDRSGSSVRRGLHPDQVVLLNSLRRLLAVVPQCEGTLAGWCKSSQSHHHHQHTPKSAPSPRSPTGAVVPITAANTNPATDGPPLGSHFAQLVKELRTQFFACITLCAEDLAARLTAHSTTSVTALLQSKGISVGVEEMEVGVLATLEATDALVRWLASALEGRVFVALSRGLWDLSAREVLRYAEDLSEGTDGQGGGDDSSNINDLKNQGKGAWRGRRNAATVLRLLCEFYQRELSSALGSDLAEKDVAWPQHAERARKLLADNSTGVDMSFDVY